MNNYLTASIPGTGGQIKEAPEDFFVSEIPLYLPCGEGEHLYIEVEKVGLTTFTLMQKLSAALGVSEREMGYAGLKDARATTRQTVSVPGIRPEQLEGVEIEGVRILGSSFHRNKLRLGHLAGNRFVIRLRAPGEGALEHARDAISILADLGVPNRFGEQRYGVLDNSHRIGRNIIAGNFGEAARLIVGEPERIRNDRWREGAERFAAGDLQGALQALPGRQHDERRLIHALIAGKSPAEAVLSLPRKMLRLYLSAFQSHLFDRIVEMRLHSLETLWAGDLAYKHDNGACFVVEDPALEQPRADRFEISPSGPLFGRKVTMAKGEAGILEQGLLQSEGIGLESFRLGGGLTMDGERRPLRVPLADPEVNPDGEDLLFSFSLPRGSYATSVLREVIKG